MAKLTKKQKDVAAKFDVAKAYNLSEASSIVKDTTSGNFDASVDLAIRLGVDPRKANQMVRGVVTLPHGTGKDVTVLVLCTPDKEEEAKAAGADHVGLDEYVEKIKGGVCRLFPVGFYKFVVLKFFRSVPGLHLSLGHGC